MISTASSSVASHGGVRFAPSRVVIGVAAGSFAAVVWATYLIASKAGTAQGLMPQDIALLRFATAALIMLPWLLGHDPARLAGIGWRRAVILTIVAGPPFIALSTGAYLFAPLAHGAVIQPSTVTLASMAAAALLLKERMTRGKLAGVALVVAGLAVIASHAQVTGDRHVWIGDMLFISAGLSWASFTVLLKRWNLDALSVTAAVSVVSALAVVPLFLLRGDFSRIAALPLEALVTQIVVQGVLSGVLAFIAFGVAVRHLGAARPGLFPAIVPVATLLLGIPVTGNIPVGLEMIGAALATLGVVSAIGFVRPLNLSSPQAKG